jgi:hypothetical protein
VACWFVVTADEDSRAADLLTAFATDSDFATDLASTDELPE